MSSGYRLSGRHQSCPQGRYHPPRQCSSTQTCWETTGHSASRTLLASIVLLRWPARNPVSARSLRSLLHYCSTASAKGPASSGKGPRTEQAVDTLLGPSLQCITRMVHGGGTCTVALDLPLWGANRKYVVKLATLMHIF